jgi:RsmE family RNA methyltransferase
MPRPKVLQRTLAHAAALGFGRICIIRSKRTVKSHFDSHVLESEQLREHLMLGLEQSRRVHLPIVTVHSRFRPFVEDELDGIATSCRVLADSDAPESIVNLKVPAAPLTLVIGPEGGLIPYEIDHFRERGFSWVNVGHHPLRVEAALNFVSGALFSIREQVRTLGATKSSEGMP